MKQIDFDSEISKAVKESADAIPGISSSLKSLKSLNQSLEEIWFGQTTIKSIRSAEWLKCLDGIGNLPHLAFSKVEIKPFLPEMNKTFGWAQNLIESNPATDRLSFFGPPTKGKSFYTHVFLDENFERSLEQVIESYKSITTLLDPTKPKTIQDAAEEPPVEKEPETPAKADELPADLNGDVHVTQGPPPEKVDDTKSQMLFAGGSPIDEHLTSEVRNFSSAVTNLVINIAEGGSMSLHIESMNDIKLEGPLKAQISNIRGQISQSRSKGGRPQKFAVKFTQREIAAAFGVSEDTAARWDKGESNPPIGYSRDLRERGTLLEMKNVIDDYRNTKLTRDAYSSGRLRHGYSDEQIERERLK